MHPDRDSLDQQLAELGRAERSAAPGNAWARVAARLDQPSSGVRARLAWRGMTAFLEPAVAGGFAAALAGLAVGTWLALSTNSATEVAAAQPYDVSSLVEDDASGLATHYWNDTAATDATSEAAPTDSGGGAR